MIRLKILRSKGNEEHQKKLCTSHWASWGVIWLVRPQEQRVLYHCGRRIIVKFFTAYANLRNFTKSQFQLHMKISPLTLVNIVFKLISSFSLSVIPSWRSPTGPMVDHWLHHPGTLGLCMLPAPQHQVPLQGWQAPELPGLAHHCSLLSVHWIAW